MKKIVFTRPDGGVSVVHPFEGARLCLSIALNDGRILKPDSEGSVTADTFLRRWPVDGAVAEWAETEDEFAARIAAKDVPADAANVSVVDEEEIPADRTFRDAWVHNGAAVVHDMPKAREIHKHHLRSARAPLLAALDVEYQRADEVGDVSWKADVSNRKRELRDVTKRPEIADASTIDDLKKVKI
jgi:hypothetical protein